MASVAAGLGVLGSGPAPNVPFWRREALAIGGRRGVVGEPGPQAVAIRLSGVWRDGVPAGGAAAWLAFYAVSVETLAFLFSDIEGSTALLGRLGDRRISAGAGRSSCADPVGVGVQGHV